MEEPWPFRYHRGQQTTHARSTECFDWAFCLSFLRTPAKSLQEDLTTFVTFCTIGAIGSNRCGRFHRTFEGPGSTRFRGRSSSSPLPHGRASSRHGIRCEDEGLKTHFPAQSCKRSVLESYSVGRRGRRSEDFRWHETNMTSVLVGVRLRIS